MIKGIIYTSRTGNTKEYAKMLSSELNIPCYDLKEKNNLTKSDEILYMGWAFASQIKGLKKACEKYTVKYACGVGMGTPSDQVERYIKEDNISSEIKVYYLEGGFSAEKQTGIYKFMINTMIRQLYKKVEEKKELSKDDQEMLDALNSTENVVKKENLIEILSVLRK